VLLFNPLFLFLPVLKGHWEKKVISFSLVMMGIYVIVMINKPHLLLMFPFIIVTFYILLNLLKNQNRKTAPVEEAV
jgi:hypothetical protein